MSRDSRTFCCSVLFLCHLSLLSNSSYKEDHTFSFARYHSAGVATATFSSKHSVLVVVGFDGDEPSLDDSGEMD